MMSIVKRLHAALGKWIESRAPKPPTPVLCHHGKADGECITLYCKHCHLERKAERICGKFRDVLKKDYCDHPEGHAGTCRSVRLWSTDDARDCLLDSVAREVTMMMTHQGASSEQVGNVLKHIHSFKKQGRSADVLDFYNQQVKPFMESQKHIAHVGDRRV